MIRYLFPLVSAGLMVAVVVLIFLLPTPSVTAEAPQALTSVVLQNVRLVEGSGLSEPVSVLIKDGVIAETGTSIATPEQMLTIDGEGATALPGLIDAHTHSYGPSLADALRFGVTTSLDMFTDASQLRTTIPARNSKGATQSSDLFSAGMMATAPSGHGTQFGVRIETLTAPDQAADWVAARKKEGSDYIKMVYIPYQDTLPSIDRPIATAVIRAAHDQGLMALAHISTEAAARDLIEDGIDGLVHIFADKDVSDETLELAKNGGIFIIPTLSVISAIDGSAIEGSAIEGSANIEALAESNEVAPYLSGFQKQALKATFPQHLPGYSASIAARNVKRFHDMGVPILAGSDAPNPGTAPGLSLHDELQHLVAAGLTRTEAIDAATRIPAQIFSLKERGDLARGSRADIVLVDGDPTRDISATLKIKMIFKNGHVVSRNPL